MPTINELKELMLNIRVKISDAGSLKLKTLNDFASCIKAGQ